jgi:hypothetical protein
MSTRLSWQTQHTGIKPSAFHLLHLVSHGTDDVPQYHSCTHAGVLAGTAIVSVASTLGAVLAFLLAQNVAQPWVESRLEGMYVGSCSVAIKPCGTEYARDAARWHKA